MAPAFPRVLVITSNNFNLRAGGGITLTNLFRGWPADRLANLHEDSTPPDRSVCTNFFQLTRREVRWSWPFSLAEPGRSADAEETGALASTGRRPWRRRIVGEGVPRDVTITPALAAWIDAFRPSIAYGFLGSMAQIRITRAIADRWSLPVVIHIMDDWPAVIYRGSVIGPAIRATVLREFRHLLDRAAARFAISEAMALEYEARYGRAFDVFHNAIDVDEWSRAALGGAVAQPAVVRYVGSVLAEAQLSAIHDVADAVAQLRTDRVDVTLSVHVPEEQSAPLRAWGFSEQALRIGPTPRPEEVPAMLASADVLLLPFNFDAASTAYMRLSMPTKVPAYLASGTPILVYGPPQVAAVAYASRQRWAEVVGERSVPALCATIRRLLTDGPLRRMLAERALDVARANHDAPRVRERFRAALESAEGAGAPLRQTAG